MQPVLALILAVPRTALYAQSETESPDFSNSSTSAEACFNCHDPVVEPKFNDVALKFGSSLNTIHLEAGVGCGSCHSVHSAKNLAGAYPSLGVCAGCHASIVGAYKAGEHFKAFSELGFSHCAVCHDVHAPADAVTSDLTSPQEQGLESTRATCLSCHFTGSEHERTVFKYETALEDTDKVCGKLDVAITGYVRLNSTLPPFMRVKADSIPDGEYYRAMARAGLHGVGAGIDANLTAMTNTLEETIHLSAVAFARVFTFYGMLILIALIVIIHNMRKSARRRMRYRLGSGTNGRSNKE